MISPSILHQKQPTPAQPTRLYKLERLTVLKYRLRQLYHGRIGQELKNYWKWARIFPASFEHKYRHENKL